MKAGIIGFVCTIVVSTDFSKTEARIFDECTTEQCCAYELVEDYLNCNSIEDSCFVECTIKFGQGEINADQLRDCMRDCSGSRLLCEEVADLEYDLCLEGL